MQEAPESRTRKASSFRDPSVPESARSLLVTIAHTWIYLQDITFYMLAKVNLDVKRDMTDPTHLSNRATETRQMERNF